MSERQLWSWTRGCACAWVVCFLCRSSSNCRNWFRLLLIYTCSSISTKNHQRSMNESKFITSQTSTGKSSICSIYFGCWLWLLISLPWSSIKLQCSILIITGSIMLRIWRIIIGIHNIFIPYIFPVLLCWLLAMEIFPHLINQRLGLSYWPKLLELLLLPMLSISWDQSYHTYIKEDKSWINNWPKFNVLAINMTLNLKCFVEWGMNSQEAQLSGSSLA